MICRVVYVLLLIVSTGALASDDSARDDVLITLERTSCYGSCPVYKLTIRGDGSVTYEGQKFVRVEATRQITVDPSKVLELTQAFVDVGYFDLRDHYRETLQTSRRSTPPSR